MKFLLHKAKGEWGVEIGANFFEEEKLAGV